MTPAPRRARLALTALALASAAALGGCRWHHPGHDSDYPRGDRHGDHGDHHDGGDHDHGGYGH